MPKHLECQNISSTTNCIKNEHQFRINFSKKALTKKSIYTKTMIYNGEINLQFKFSIKRGKNTFYKNSYLLFSNLVRLTSKMSNNEFFIEKSENLLKEIKLLLTTFYEEQSLYNIQLPRYYKF